MNQGKYRNAWRLEAEDLALLLFTAGVVLLAWILALSWRPSHLIGASDAPGYYLLLRDLASNQAPWTDLLYRLDRLGGTNVYGTLGEVPVFLLFLRLGADPVAVFNAGILLSQISIAYLCLRMAEDLSSAWKARAGLRETPSGRAPLAWAARIGLVAVSAFSPILGWRIGFGHFNMLWGLVPILGVSALAVGLRAGRGTILLLLVSFLGTANAMSFVTYQFVAYSAVFGGPMVLVLLCDPGLGRRQDTPPATRDVWGRVFTWLLPLLWIGCASLTSLVPFERVWSYRDGVRGVGVSMIPGGYLVASWRDLASDLFLAANTISRQAPFKIHEVSTPIGPAALWLLALVPWRRNRPLAMGAAASLLLSLAFAMDFKPMSSLLLRILPFLGMFRVTTRCLAPVFFLLLILGSAGVLYRNEAREDPWNTGVCKLLGFAAAAAAVFLLPAWWREGIAWGVALAFALGTFVSPRLRIPAALVLLIAGAASIGAFRQRLFPLEDYRVIGRDLDHARRSILEQAPALASPLERGVVGASERHFRSNTPLATGISSLSGYWYPSERFLRLVEALAGLPFPPGALNIDIRRHDPGFDALAHLYNIRHDIDLSGGRPRVSRIAAGARPAWFSSRVALVDSDLALAAKLHAASRQCREWPETCDPARPFQTTAWIVAGDPFFEDHPDLLTTLKRSDFDACGRAVVEKIESDRTRVRLSVDAPADCPLAIAMNFASNLEATSMDPKGRIKIRVFPVDQALTGLLVPRGKHRIEIGPSLDSPVWTRFLALLGWVMALGILAWFARTRVDQSRSRSSMTD